MLLTIGIILSFLGVILVLISVPIGIFQEKKFFVRDRKKYNIALIGINVALCLISITFTMFGFITNEVMYWRTATAWFFITYLNSLTYIRKI